MKLPFGIADFLGVFKRYNEAVWPMQFVLVAVAAIILGLMVWHTRYSDKWISGLLAGLWLWMGVVYHWMYFTAINPAAYYFGAFFVVESALVAWFGVVRPRLSFHFRRGVIGITGAALMAYALLIYPIFSHAAGHIYPESPSFGLPCPTTIFTFGLLLWSDRPAPLGVVAIPAMWSLIGSYAAFSLTMVEDYGLLAAGIAGTALMIRKNQVSPVRHNG